MHPEMIRAIAVQQIGDWQAEAQARLQVRLARQARRARRHGRKAADPLAGVRVPDYVDGTYRDDAGLAGRTAVPDGAGPAAPAPAGGRGVPAGRDPA